MSKTGELKTIMRGLSIDAPINYRHRSGDIEGNGGSRLDYYAQTESAEEVYLQSEDEKARRVFLKLFKKFLKRTYTKDEIKFLLMSTSGAGVRQLRERFGITDILKHRQEIMRKGYENAEALRAVVTFSGWSRAEEFANTLFKRVELFRRGENVIEELPEIKKAIRLKEKKARLNKIFWDKNKDRYNAIRREGRKTEPEKEKNREYKRKNRERFKEYKKRYIEKHPEQVKALYKRYREKHAEEIKERDREYKRNHAEQVKAHKKRYREKHAEEIREKAKEYIQNNAEKIRAQKRAYYKKHAKKVYESVKAWRERKKIEKEAAKLRAREGLQPIEIPTAPPSYVYE